MSERWTELYQGRLIGAPTVEAIRTVVRDYEVMLISILETILERYERHADYHFIDTKFSTITGEDFPEPDDPSRDFRGLTAIYGWIQGRGLEALAGHIRWLPFCSLLSADEQKDRVKRATRMLSEVLEQMEGIRARNHGRVAFLMTPDGRPFELDAEGRRRVIELDPARTSGADLFYAKGLFAAARVLGDAAREEAAKALFREVVEDIRRGRQAGNRVSFDPKNPVGATPGKQGHGSRMIAILGFAVLAEELGDEQWYAGGEEFVRHVVDRHIVVDQTDGLQPYDFVESVDAAGKPWREHGRILSDPGHSLEFIGLAAKFLLLLRAKAKRTLAQEELLTRCVDLFPRVLLRNFENGFNPKVGGICKAFDLVARWPINSDMPWWNLPETMRAAAELLLLCPQSGEREKILGVIQAASNGFVRSFVNRRARLSAYQTVGAQGKPVDVIPATPDADPGYHTGLSLIDFLRCVGKS